MKFFASKKAAPSSFGFGESPSEAIGGALGELSCNSPSGPMRLGRGKGKLLGLGGRGSPYDKKKSKGGKKGSSLLSLGAVDSPSTHKNLFSPGAVTRSAASQYTATKIVTVKVPAAGASNAGIKFFKHGATGPVLVGGFTVLSSRVAPSADFAFVNKTPPSARELFRDECMRDMAPCGWHKGVPAARRL